MKVNRGFHIHLHLTTIHSPYFAERVFYVRYRKHSSVGMASSCLHLIVTFLLFCMTFANKMEVKNLKYCGPPDKTLKFHVTPFPVISLDEPVNVTFTFTAAVDVLDYTLRFIATHQDGKPFWKGSDMINCTPKRMFCNLAAGETYTESFDGYIPFLSTGFLKGTFKLKAEAYNDDEFVWFCFEGEAAFY